MTSNLESVNSYDYQELLHDHGPEKTILRIELETFALPRLEEIISHDRISTSSFLQELITASSNELNEKLDYFLTSAVEESTTSHSLSSDTSFTPGRGSPS